MHFVCPCLLLWRNRPECLWLTTTLHCLSREWDSNPCVHKQTVLQTAPFNHSGIPTGNPACQRTSYSEYKILTLYSVFISCKTYIFEPSTRIELVSPEYHTEILSVKLTWQYVKNALKTKNPELFWIPGSDFISVLFYHLLIFLSQ